MDTFLSGSRKWGSISFHFKASIADVFDQRLKSRPNLVRRANLPNTLVVEVKFAPADRAMGEQVLQGIPIRVSRNSKYAIAVQSILA